MQLVESGFDILTYRKGSALAGAQTSLHRAHRHASTAAVRSYVLADQGVRLLGGKLRLRQVTRLTDGGTRPTSSPRAADLPAVEVAFRMFERWRQENFFKYLREEYALDALVD